jgi:hypothetical protein
LWSTASTAGTTLCSSSGRLRPEGVDLSDVDALGDMLSALDGDGPVGVDLGDRVGTGGARTELGGTLDLEENLLAWLVVEGVALQVGAAELLADEDLTAIVDEREVGQERDVEDHVVVESNDAGQSTEGAVDRGTKGVASCSKGCVDEIVDSVGVVGRLSSKRVRMWSATVRCIRSQMALD